MQIIDAQTPFELDLVRGLFREYHEYLKTGFGLELNYQGIQAELDDLPGKYAPPQGRLKLAVEDGRALGCVAMRPLEERACEMKRMYVPGSERGRGIGRRLAEALIEDARQAGYRVMRLDTALFLTTAVRLYESLGFRRVEPYGEVPADIREIAIFMELELN